jgi:hypothetical protein
MATAPIFASRPALVIVPTPSESATTQLDSSKRFGIAPDTISTKCAGEPGPRVPQPPFRSHAQSIYYGPLIQPEFCEVCGSKATHMTPGGRGFCRGHRSEARLAMNSSMGEFVSITLGEVFRRESLPNTLTVWASRLAASIEAGPRFASGRGTYGFTHAM